jgi:AcrR family transcriptional regulator
MPSTPSARQRELLELAYAYVLDHGLAGLSLRPLATAIGSSPRVLLFLYGSKDELVRALLARARTDELDLLARLRTSYGGQAAGLVETAEVVWDWLAAEEHRAVLKLWVEAYGRSLVETDGPWAEFARSTVRDWLDLLKESQPPRDRRTHQGSIERTLVLAVLRGALLDLLATGEAKRTGAAVRAQLAALRR